MAVWKIINISTFLFYEAFRKLFFSKFFVCFDFVLFGFFFFSFSLEK